MKPDSRYSLSKKFSITRSVADVDTEGLPQVATDREVFHRIRAQYGKFASPMPTEHAGDPSRQTFPGQSARVIYLPWSAFRKRIKRNGIEIRADVGGSTFATFGSIKPERGYTGGILAHNKIFLAGARVIEGISGQMILTGTTALPQPAFSTNTDGTSVLTQSDPVFTGGSVGANSMIYSPLRLTFKTQMSRQLYVQGGPFFEAVLREQVSRGISGMLDNLALYGSGASGQCLGLYSTVTPSNLGTAGTQNGTLTSGSTSVTALTSTATLAVGNAVSGVGIAAGATIAQVNSGTAITLSIAATATGTNALTFNPAMSWTQYQAYKEAVLETDLDPDSYGLIMSPMVQNVLDSTQWVPGASYSVLEKIKDGDPSKVFVGNEIAASSPSGAKALFIGLWRFLTIMLWNDGIELQLDPFSAADKEYIVVRANLLANVGCTFPGAFAAVKWA
jgi:hypothetical protein